MNSSSPDAPPARFISGALGFAVLLQLGCTNPAPGGGSASPLEPGPRAEARRGAETAFRDGPESAEETRQPRTLLEAPECKGEGEVCRELRAAAQALVRRGGSGAGEARAHLERVRALGDDSPTLYLLRGRTEAHSESLAYGEGRGGAARALIEFEAAIERDESLLVARLERARMLLSLGRGAEAEAPLRQLLAAAPEDAEVRGALGVSLLSQGQIEAAKLEFERATRLEPTNAERWVALGATQMLLSDLSAAEASFRTALHLDAGSVRAHADLGSLYLLRAETRQGRAHLERALHLSPRSPAVLTNLAYADYLDGEFESARQRAEAALKLDPTFASAWLNLALALAAERRLDAARDAIERARKLNPDDPRVATALEDLHALENVSVK